MRKTMLAVVAVLWCCGWADGQTQIVPTSPVAPVTTQPGKNWDQPHWVQGTADACQNAVCTPASSQMGINFTLAAAQNHTSAAIYNAAGTLIAHLWYNRAYQPGTYGVYWDGLDDYGNAATGGPFTAKIEYDNVVHNWDGIIGNTESSWSGPYNWDLASAFPRGLAFINGTAYAAEGYDENDYPGYSFLRDNPNGQVLPFIDRRMYNHVLNYVATDGNLLYYVMQGYGTGQLGGVFAITPSGNFYSFSSGTGSAQFGGSSNPYIPMPNVTVSYVDPTTYGSSVITGIAVQRSGNVLATAHGQWGSGTSNINSADTVYLWNKTTGAAMGSVSVPNPQQMAFDGNGNLWVISGYGPYNGAAGANAVYEVTGVGGANTVTTPISGLQDPVAVAASPVTGNIFVADGGSHQQVYEYSPSTYALVSTLGQAGGYGNATTCNANIDPQGHNAPTFFFDPDTSNLYMTGVSTNLNSWIALDDQGGMWVTDYFTNRVLHYTKSGSTWNYVNRIMMSGYANYRTLVPVGSPTRLWSGVGGWLEYSINYNVPLLPGDPEAAGGNGSWDVVRNWMPCIWQQVPTTVNNHSMFNYDMYTYSNGVTVSMPFGSTNAGTAFYSMPTSGVLGWGVPQTHYVGYGWLDQQGRLYGLGTTGTAPNYTYTINQEPVTGFDANGFPIWGAGVALGSYQGNPSLGIPSASNESSMAFGPTTSGTIPIFDGLTNTAVTGGTPAFHMGFLKTGGTSLFAMSMPQKGLRYTDGSGGFPAASYAGKAQMGTIAVSVNNDIFAFINGNWGPQACQYFQYRDDGMFVSQFGWQTSFAYGNFGTWAFNGMGRREMGVPASPGFCGDVPMPRYVQVGSDDYIYIGDEGYYKGSHRWHISNLGSIHEAAGTGNLGAVVTVSQVY